MKEEVVELIRERELVSLDGVSFCYQESQSQSLINHFSFATIASGRVSRIKSHNVVYDSELPHRNDLEAFWLRPCS